MREKELRLALICYGGISLAVYMHGITLEIWRLARASRAFHDGSDHDGPGDGTAPGDVYHRLLARIESETGVRLRVLVDIVAGASAGGINGLFLGHAIATGQPLDPLTALWLDVADVDRLIDTATAPLSRTSRLWATPIAWWAAGRPGGAVDRTVEADARGEIRAKLTTFVRARWFTPPFSGANFTGLLLDAFDLMAAGGAGPALLPPGQPLDLFVTVTDFRGHPERLSLHSPAEVMETEHRLVVPFTDHGVAGETLAHPAELAFAGRATSSFPGAFPPFTVRELDAVLKTRQAKWPERLDFLKRILPRQFAVNGAEDAVLIDGSVLANAPFRPAIDALRERPARRQIDRRFIYIDPSPGRKIHFGDDRQDSPSFFQTILGAVSDLPRQQPIRDNLEAIAATSARIERMRGIIAAIRPEVEAEVEALFGYTLFLDKPTTARLAAWRTRAAEAAASKAGYSYAAYGHLKIVGVIELITGLLYHAGGEPGPDKWRRIHGHVCAALAARGFDAAGPSFAGGANAATILFLRGYDLAFRIRRLRILVRRVSDLETDNSTDYAALREAIYLSLAAYLDRKRTDVHAHLRRDIRALKGDAGPLLDALATSLDLKRLDTETDARLADAFAALPKEARRPILLTYLGFPYFDTATLPLLQGEGLDEFDPIKVDRIAPDDARSIRGGGAEATLKGIQFNNFGAFFSRAYRENDYLWGRLHGAERMIDIVVSTLPEGARLKPGRVARIKRAAFLAILDEEAGKLTAVSGLIETLRGEIG